MGSHRLEVEVEHTIPWEDKVCRLFHVHEIEMEEHIFASYLL